jgi:hypothetical protein
MNPFALGVALGTVLWNLIFVGLSAVGLISPEMAWVSIQIIYGLAFGWLITAFIGGLR